MALNIWGLQTAQNHALHAAAAKKKKRREEEEQGPEKETLGISTFDEMENARQPPTPASIRSRRMTRLASQARPKACHCFSPKTFRGSSPDGRREVIGQMVPDARAAIASNLLQSGHRTRSPTEGVKRLHARCWLATTNSLLDGGNWRGKPVASTLFSPFAKRDPSWQSRGEHRHGS